jgi:hypothetical protein
MMLRAAPRRVAAGQVSLLAVNHGTRTHELVVLPVSPDARVGTRPAGADGADGTDGTVSETGSLGQASRSCGAGGGDGIPRARPVGSL